MIRGTAARSNGMQATREEKRLWARYWVTGTIAARNALVEHYWPIAEQNARYWFTRLSHRIDVNDLESLASERLIIAVETYRPIFRTRFSTHATNCIRTSYWRAATLESRNVRMTTKVNLDAIQIGDDLVRPTEIDPDELSRSLERAEYLGWREKEFLRLRAEGLVLREIGERYGITKERVRQVLRRAISEIRRRTA
jgi:RNA polymerase sigma factor (sigma-70 family)